jgi:hypothetical protein
MDPCHNPVKVNGSMNGGRVTGLKVGEGYGFGNRTANLVQLRRFDEYLLMAKIRSP